jgi:hypothetical protein
VIVENGIGAPKVDLVPLTDVHDEGEINHLGIHHDTGFPIANIRFSLLH